METTVYRIRVRGHLRPEWSEWFGGMEIAHEANGDSVLSGPVPDQAALHGLLTKVRDLGLTLVSLDGTVSKSGATLHGRRT
jgi:hypothetical protein